MRTFLFSILFFSIFQLFGQQNFVSHDFIPGNIPNYKPGFQEDFPDWAKLLYQESINYFEVEAAFEKWEATDPEEFRPIRKYFKIWQQNILPFVTSSGEIELDKLDTFYKNVSFHNQNNPSPTPENGSEWEFLGPKETFWLNESGSAQTPLACPWQVNIYTFDVAETNSSILYCGTETGYVSKTVDNGDSWELLARGYSMGGAVTAIAIHPENENVVYAAGGMQIHKTTDGGLTWSPMLPPNGLFNADKITIDPENPDKIFAGGNTGIYRSLDGGLTWSNVWNAQTYDIHTKPDDSNTVYGISSVSGNFRIVISTDGGNTFSIDSTFPTVQNAAGALIAVTPAAPDNLYAILLGNNNTPLLYRGNMTSGGWELLATGQTNAFPLNNGQGFFDLVLEVSPINENLIFAGTTTLYKSTNGGTNFSIIGGYGGNFPIHPDIQCMKVLENGTTWVSTDGGFTFSTDNFISPTNAIAKNKNLVGSDMWGFDQGWNEDIVVGGRYHNGNTAIADFYQPKALRMGGAESPTGWIMKGKSKHVAFNDLGPGWILPETAESEPQGRFIFSKYPNMDEYGGRRGNMFFHPNYYEVIYLGEGNGFWKSSDMGTSFELLYNFPNRVRFCQIAYDDPDIMYADIVNRGLYKSEDGGISWTAKPTLTDGGFGTSYWEGKLHFVISPTDANTIYACLQNGTWSSDKGKIFKSIDGGNSWEDWTGTLDEFTKTLAIQPDADGNDIVYLFTDNNSGKPGQCYIRRDGENNWSAYGDAYPARMSPNHALPFFRDSKIRVAGNGGIWENMLDEPNFQPIVQPWIERPFFNCMLDTIQLEDHSIVNHENCTWTWEIQPAPLYMEDENMRNPKVVLGNPGSYDVTLTITKDGVSYSKTITNMMETIECPSLDNCENPSFLPKNNWELLYVNSEEVNFPGYATMAFDNNPETIWHTRWSTGSDPYPHEMQIDLGEVFDIHEFTYFPRQDGQNGWIKDYELYFSEDASDWGDADRIGEFEKSAAPHKVTFQNPVTGRYFRLVALSEANGNAWASAAEFEIKGCYTESTSTYEIFNYKYLKAFPVPTKGIFEVSLPFEGVFEYSITNISGVMLESGSRNLNVKSLSLDLSNYENGIYVIRLLDDLGRTYFVKVVKE
jgi:photosystem II stability/assembly factor-like uncharacterized protein